MSSLARENFLTADAYLAWETRQPYKNEYINGEVFAMAGASIAHVTIALNLAIALRTHLLGTSCIVLISDAKLRVEAENAFFYPDVFVTCSAADRELPHYQSEPSLIAEILSPSTCAYDRGAKFAAYRKLPSLHEYLLIDSERLSVDLFRRNQTNQWVLYPFDALDQQITLESVELQLPLHSLYENALPTTMNKVA